MSKDKKKKFVRYQEGADIYSMSVRKFQDLAKDAGAIFCDIPRGCVDRYFCGNFVQCTCENILYLPINKMKSRIRNEELYEHY